VPIHGIGTQMHMNINTSKTNIDDMFKEMAATDLQIKVTELDIRINPNDQATQLCSHFNLRYTNMW
jgi:endo-1,4-beta-xylanase